jgi:membrane associated rhomboid family serine protease
VFIPLFFHIPAMVFAGIWFLTQVMQGTSELFTPSGGSGIAWLAHIGGFAAGWLLLHWLDGSPRPTTSRRAWYNGGPWEGGRS